MCRERCIIALFGDVHHVSTSWLCGDVGMLNDVECDVNLQGDISFVMQTSPTHLYSVLNTFHLKSIIPNFLCFVDKLQTIDIFLFFPNYFCYHRIRWNKKRCSKLIPSIYLKSTIYIRLYFTHYSLHLFLPTLTYKNYSWKVDFPILSIYQTVSVSGVCKFIF